MTDTQKKLRKAGIVTSFVIGLPAWLAVIALLFAGNGDVFVDVVIVLTIAYFGGLWYGGRSIGRNLQEGDTILQASFMYSLRVHAVIWSAFFLLNVAIQRTAESLLMIIPAIGFFLIWFTITTLTVGLLVCWWVNHSMEKIDRVSFDEKFKKGW